MPNQEYRTLYLLIYPSRPFAAHWSLFLPYKSPSSPSSTKIGKRIHATGDRLNGFTLEIVRNYDRAADLRTPSLHSVGRVLSSHVSDYDEDDVYGGKRKEETVDYIPRNELEAACLAIKAPGPSMNRVGAGNKGGQTNGAPPKKNEVRDCQWWVRECVGSLCEKGMLLAEEDNDFETPMSVVSALPKH